MASETPTETLVTSPAKIDPDPAAVLDPAKDRLTGTMALTTPKPKRKRHTRTKKQEKAVATAKDAGKSQRKLAGAAATAVARKAAAQANEGRASYQAATLHLVDSYGALPAKEALHMRFANGDEFVTEGVEVPRDHLAVRGEGAAARAIYERVADFTPNADPMLVAEAWLIAETGEAARCEVGSGLVAGGGKHAMIPAGHLIF